MANFLKNKVALVTGGGRGVGRAIAVLMAQEGAAVVINDDGVDSQGAGGSKAPADAAAAEIKAAGGRALATYEDVSTMRGAEKAVEAAVKTFGKLDIAVTGHVIARDSSILDVSEADWDRVFNVDVKGAFNVLKNACLVFRQQRSGRVLLIGSEAGFVANAGQVSYSAAQGGIAGLTRVAHLDMMDRYGVTVNCVCPRGRARRPDGASKAGGRAAPAAPAVNEDTRDAQGTAALTAFLASDLGAQISGQFFLVDGGAISILSHSWPIRSICKLDRWTLDELDALAPKTVGADLPNAVTVKKPA